MPANKNKIIWQYKSVITLVSLVLYVKNSIFHGIELTSDQFDGNSVILVVSCNYLAKSARTNVTGKL